MININFGRYILSLLLAPSHLCSKSYISIFWLVSEKGGLDAKEDYVPGESEFSFSSSS